MKRITAILLSTILLLAVFAGCSVKNSIVGTWKTDIDIADAIFNTISDELGDSYELAKPKSDFNIEAYLQLTEDGKYRFAVDRDALSASTKNYLIDFADSLLDVMVAEFGESGISMDDMDQFAQEEGYDSFCDYLIGSIADEFDFSDAFEDATGAYTYENGKLTFNNNDPVDAVISGDKLTLNISDFPEGTAALREFGIEMDELVFTKVSDKDMPLAAAGKDDKETEAETKEEPVNTEIEVTDFSEETEETSAPRETEVTPENQDDPYTLTVNGVSYSVNNFNEEDFAKHGMILDYQNHETSDVIEPDDYFYFSYVPEDGDGWDESSLTLMYNNDSNDEATFDQCRISYIEVEVGESFNGETFLYEDHMTFNYLGAKNGMTYEELAAALGETESSYEHDDYTYYSWDIDEHISIEICVADGIGAYDLTIYYYHF